MKIKLYWVFAMNYKYFNFVKLLKTIYIHVEAKRGSSEENAFQEKKMNNLNYFSMNSTNLPKTYSNFNIKFLKMKNGFNSKYSNF